MGLKITQVEIDTILDKLTAVDRKYHCFNDGFSDWEDQLYDIEYELGRDEYDVRFGASKCAIVPIDPNVNYVIKIPFHYNGDIYCSSYTATVSRWDSDRQTYYHTWTHVQSDGSEFSCAEYPISGGHGWDYCQSEAEYYEVAKQYGIDEMFAETRLIGYVNGYPVYAQERCEPLCEVDESNCYSKNISDELVASYDSVLREKCSKSTYQHDPKYGWKLDREFELAIADTYSLKTLLGFFDFFEHETVGDFHRANIGFFRDSHKPCVFDYSGYWD